MPIRLTCIVASLLVSFAFLSCQQQVRNVAAWPYGVKYEVFVLSFADGNGDGKGDFKGLAAKLGYLQELGVNGIWLMPIMNSPSYHKYDVTDYKSIHPDYGTVEEFKTFVAEAHRRNIRVVVDLILNHTGAEHPWFKSASADKHSPNRDYYVWARRDSIRNQIAKKTTAFDSDNLTQWHAVNGDTLSEQYYGYFWGGMPDLNFDNPKVKEEFNAIGKFWLSDMNVDGFRLDAARHIFPADRAADNHAFWEAFRANMKKIKPDVYLVGEVWSTAPEVAPYLKGLPSLFNFDMGYKITDVVNAGKDTIGLIKKYKEIVDYYHTINPDYVDATFLKNHDQNRILSEFGGNKSKMRVAAGILLTLPGTPYLYYGEEIGMLGKKPDANIREPFLWDITNTDGPQTSWEKPVYSTVETVIPARQQQSDRGSMLTFYKNLIYFRNASPVMTYGALEESGVNASEVVGYKRTYKNEMLLVLNNISDVEVTLNLTEQNNVFTALAFDSSKKAKLQAGELTLPAYSTVILKP